MSKGSYFKETDKLRFSLLELHVFPWHSVISHVECEMLSKVSTTTSAAIFRINIVGLEGRVGSSHIHTAAGGKWQVELWFQNMSNS
jgi:hypothetical protein